MSQSTPFSSQLSEIGNRIKHTKRYLTSHNFPAQPNQPSSRFPNISPAFWAQFKAFQRLCRFLPCVSLNEYKYCFFADFLVLFCCYFFGGNSHFDIQIGAFCGKKGQKAISKKKKRWAPLIWLLLHFIFDFCDVITGED